MTKFFKTKYFLTFYLITLAIILIEFWYGKNLTEMEYIIHFSITLAMLGFICLRAWRHGWNSIIFG
jgi:hypothetical protein